MKRAEWKVRESLRRSLRRTDGRKAQSQRNGQSLWSTKGLANKIRKEVKVEIAFPVAKKRILQTIRGISCAVFHLDRERQRKDVEIEIGKGLKIYSPNLFGRCLEMSWDRLELILSFFCFCLKVDPNRKILHKMAANRIQGRTFLQSR